MRHQLQEHDMPVDDAPEDDDVRQTYNFAPGNYGLVYRADVPGYRAGGRPQGSSEGGHTEQRERNEKACGSTTQMKDLKETKYKLQSMKWGLVPFWTKRNPDYGTVMKTINARDDSLARPRGMWNTMKQRKRCIVVAQGFYEWLKRNGGKEKIPHYMKRKDEQLMCFAGLWDCVQYEGCDEKHYTYTIITTNSNRQLSFLHDRMPVILENGSDDIRMWLDPGRSEWSSELQSLLKPFDGELDCYPVSKDVGKVGNNSPTFVVPVASSENKNNIANFFSNAKRSAKGDEEKKSVLEKDIEAREKGPVVEHDEERKCATIDQSTTENNAPLPVPASMPASTGSKREHDQVADHDEDQPKAKAVKRELQASPIKLSEKTIPQKMKSATNNGTKKGSSVKSDGSQKITNFYK